MKLEAFTPAALTRARAGMDLPAAGLLPVNNPDAWQLYERDPLGTRHVWEHKPSGWLSQTLSVPCELVEDPDKAKAHRTRENAAEARARGVEQAARESIERRRAQLRALAGAKS